MQADQARDFVLAKINRSIGTRAESNIAPATYELPPDAVGEAIVNAIAHRDYHSNAAVEVRLFADRLEIWNPGSLPGTLVLEDLRHDHSSVPNNPLIAEPLYLARYIERAGSGTQSMIELCCDAGLPEPSFEQRSGFFVVTIWRNWLTNEVLASYELNDRQKAAIGYLQKNSRVSTSAFQLITKCSRRTALRDLAQLAEMGLIGLKGKGRGAHYELVPKRAINAPNAPKERL